MIFALYHSETETVGLLDQAMREKQLLFRDVHLYSGDGLPRNISDLRGLIVMGGPMNVDDVTNYPFLAKEVQLIEKVLSEDKPILGICLGAQLIAKALGSRVFKNTEKEVGWRPVEFLEKASKDPMFKETPRQLTVLHWHGDTFELPEGATHLARSSRCENQAFRWGSNVYGLQFHLEATPGMIRQWVNSRDGKADIADAGEDPKAILDETPRAYERLRPQAEKIFSSYLKLAFSEPVAVR